MPASETIANRFIIHDLQQDLLGRGGMGAVYRGLDTLTGDTVAIKALNPDLVTSNPETVKRFQREAEALRKLDHPNIVQMIAAIEEDGRHYLVVEYVESGSLRQLLDREPSLPLPRVVRIALELADALSRTHHLRIIHRDLKPANVLLTADGTPKLTDFGVASMADSNYLTQTGMWVGTPHYLSPEACNGEKLDARADIWAFGVMLYEMLAGKVPFGGDTLMATLTAIFRHPLPDLSTLRADLPEPLVNLVQHMLVKERDKRLGSMRLVAAELEAILQGKPSPGQLAPLGGHEPVDLLTLPSLEFEAMVGDALKRYRDGDWLALADSPLAHSPLVEPHFLPGQPVTGDARAQALQVMLRWGVEKLNPGGQHSWLGSSWRHYNILHFFYIDGQRVNDLAELMAIAPQTFYGGWRPQAITAVSKVLREELRTGEEVADRQRYAIQDRYQRLPAAEQRLLRLLTVVPVGAQMPVDWLYRLLPDIDVPLTLHGLLESHLLQRDEPLTGVRLQPQVHEHVAGLLSLPELEQWQRAVAGMYLDNQNYVTAAAHYRQAGDFQQAAEAIIKHRQAIFDQMQVESLRALLAQFRSAELSDQPLLWAQLKIVAGRVAEYLEDIEAAMAEYGEALGASDPRIKAEAYYLRAKVLQRHNLDESLAHFAYCVELIEQTLLQEHEAPDAVMLKLLARVYIDRAWIFIQERPNWSRAESDLKRTAQILNAVAAADRATWSDLYNARAGLAARRGDLDRSIEFRFQAWLAASETQEVDRMVRTAYNLGLDYLRQEQYKQGLAYLQRSRELARRAGDLQMQGMSHKGLGNGYFYLRQYDEAVTHYEAAYNTWLDTKNANWRGTVCYDLAEVHAETGNYAAARRYFAEGITIARELGHERFLREVRQLAVRYPLLEMEVNDRQEQALTHVRREGEVTMQTFIDLTGISRSQAHRDLSDLVDKGVLDRVGRGRATRYVLAAAGNGR